MIFGGDNFQLKNKKSLKYEIKCLLSYPILSGNETCTLLFNFLGLSAKPGELEHGMGGSVLYASYII